MVAKMKKFTFLAYYRDYDAFLHDLRDLGLIHVAASDRPVEDNGQPDELPVKLKQLREAQKILNRQIDKKSAVPPNEPDISRGKTIPREIELIQNATASLNQQLQVSIKERELLRPWGNFDPENIERLRKAGYMLDFFIVPDNRYNPEWETAYDAVVVKRETSRTYFVTLTKNEKVADKLNLESVKIPGISLTQLDGLIASLREKIRVQDQKLKALAAELPSLKAAISDIEQRMNYTRVRQSGTSLADDKLILLQGWAPADNQREISDYLESKAVYFDVSDPDPQENVPVKLTNNRFARLFEPITKMFALPVYAELDPTPFFAPFFMLFFGLCMGDAGYGILILGAATYFKIKTENNGLKPLLELFQWFGGATFVIATVTGTFFGMPLFGVPLLQTFYTRLLGAGEGADSATLAQLMQDKLMVFAIAVGILQIIFGMILSAVNIIKNDGFKYSIGRIAWIFVLVLTVVVFAFPALGFDFGDNVKQFFLYAIYAFIGVALVYNSPGKNIFVNIGSGLWNFYSLLTGIVGDALSYIRLFAIGLTGGILGGVFNQLAISMTESLGFLPLRLLFMLLILLVGHGINFGLCMISSLVHPMRLVFVEFYKNLQFTGGGEAYNPFGRKQ